MVRFASSRRAAAAAGLLALPLLAALAGAQGPPLDPVETAAPVARAGAYRARVFQAPAASELRMRREAVAQTMGNGALLLLSKPSSDDVTYNRYRPDDNFYYLTGVASDPGAVLIVAREGAIAEEVLFLPAHSSLYERWNGRRATVGPEAVELSGIERVEALAEVGFQGSISWRSLGDALAALPEKGTTRLLVDHGAEQAPPERAFGLEPRRREHLLVQSLRSDPATAALEIKAANRAIDRARVVKSAHEIELLQSAVDITGEALGAALRSARPGMYEFELMGALSGAFYGSGATGNAFAPICASGPNACVLHYVENRRQVQPGELVLLDVGAEFGYYAADITRTFPIDGRFTDEQRRIYAAVLAAQRAGEAVLRPGSSLGRVHSAASRAIKEAGFNPGEVFLHFVGHSVGLNVHDPGLRGSLEPGMVITIEPGIYLKDRSLGIRIEDMYVITEDGHRCLSAAIPKDPDAIEAWMASR